MTLKDKIAKSRELRADATQGEWEIDNEENIRAIWNNEKLAEWIGMKFTIENGMNYDNDQKFMVYAANNILDLCDALEKCIETLEFAALENSSCREAKFMCKETLETINKIIEGNK